MLTGMAAWRDDVWQRYHAKPPKDGKKWNRRMKARRRIEKGEQVMPTREEIVNEAEAAYLRDKHLTKSDPKQIYILGFIRGDQNGEDREMRSRYAPIQTSEEVAARL